MGKNNKYRNNAIPKCQNGKECRFLLGYQDVPNKYGSLKFRAAYTLISFIVLGFNLSEGNYFFVSLLMFSVPLFYDNIRFSPIEESRRFIKVISMTVLGVQGIIGIAGLLGALECVKISELLIKVSEKYIILQNKSFPLKWLWYSIGIDVILTFLDTVVALPKYSKIGAQEKVSA